MFKFIQKWKDNRKIRSIVNQLRVVDLSDKKIIYIVNKNTKARIEAILGEDMSKYEIREVPESVCKDGEIFEIVKSDEQPKQVWVPMSAPIIPFTRHKCWKCGKELTADNISDIVYTSNPPKYSCKECECSK